LSHATNVIEAAKAVNKKLLTFIFLLFKN